MTVVLRKTLERLISLPSAHAAPLRARPRFAPRVRARHRRPGPRRAAPAPGPAPRPRPRPRPPRAQAPQEGAAPTPSPGQAWPAGEEARRGARSYVRAPRLGRGRLLGRRIGPVVNGAHTSVKHPRVIPRIRDAIDVATGPPPRARRVSDGKGPLLGLGLGGRARRRRAASVDDEPVLVPKLDDGQVELASRANHTCATARQARPLLGKERRQPARTCAGQDPMGPSRVTGVVLVPNLTDAVEIVTSHTRSCARRANGRPCAGRAAPRDPAPVARGIMLQSFPRRHGRGGPRRRRRERASFARTEGPVPGRHGAWIGRPRRPAAPEASDGGQRDHEPRARRRRGVRIHPRRRRPLLGRGRLG